MAAVKCNEAEHVHGRSNNVSKLAWLIVGRKITFPLDGFTADLA